MSRSSERIQQIVDKLQANYTPREDDGAHETKDDLLLSVVVPSRNEFPNIVHTIHNIWAIWDADGFDLKDLEIIIVDNCSTDWTDEKYNWTKPGDRGTTNHIMPRGGYYNKRVKVLYDPIAGNHSARNKGIAIARGKYIFMSDAHMSYSPGTFKYLIQSIDESGGLVHLPIAWMGTYQTGVGYQYTLKVGQEWKGTWNNYCLTDQDWFYIPSLGHCSLGCRRDLFLELGGYPEYHRTYGGGELFLDMLFWMYGYPVVVEPRAIGHHLASSRGYAYHNDDYVHNIFNCMYALGEDLWLDRTYVEYLRSGRKKHVLDRMLAEAKQEMQPRRDRIARERKQTFSEMLVDPPWDMMNESKHGKANGHITVFHETWLAMLENGPAIAKEAYNKSKKQKELETFINEKLSNRVYKRKQPAPETSI